MALDCWFREDVARLLLALASAAERYPRGEFRAGYEAALLDVARGFGVAVEPPKRRDVPDRLTW